MVVPCQMAVPCLVVAVGPYRQMTLVLEDPFLTEAPYQEAPFHAAEVHPCQDHLDPFLKVVLEVQDQNWDQKEVDQIMMAVHHHEDVDLAFQVEGGLSYQEA